MHQRYYPPDPLVPREPHYPWVTWWVLGTTVAVFLLQLLSVHLRGDDEVSKLLALSTPTLEAGRYWTLLTYAWLHATKIAGQTDLFWLHIFTNMLMVYFMGPTLERTLGMGRYLGLYLGGALASGLVWLLFSSDAEANAGIIGASGAVFALVAAAGTLAPRVRVTLLIFFVVPVRMSLGAMALTLCLIEVICLIPSCDFLPGVAHIAHLGGALFGFLYIEMLRRLQAGPRVLS